MQTEGLVALVWINREKSNKRGSIHLAELVQSTLSLIDSFGPCLDHLESVLQDIAMRFQPRIQLDNTWKALK